MKKKKIIIETVVEVPDGFHKYTPEEKQNYLIDDLSEGIRNYKLIGIENA